MSSLETNTTYTSQRPGNPGVRITTKQLWGRLLFKEAKPLIPLLLSLAVLSLLGHVLIEIQRVLNSLDVMFHTIPFALNPVLFALGAAALLVSQEKEQRTLLWYSSLPIAPRTIVQSKIIVGLVGIVISWIVSLCIAIPFTSEVLQVRAESPTDILYILPISAIFVFGVTFGLAWIFGSAIPALLSLIPVVIVTVLMASLIARFDFLMAPASVDMQINNAPAITLLAFAITLGITSIVAWKMGSRSFVAPRGRAIQRTGSTSIAYRSESNFFRYKRSGETGALLWHAWMQNRTMIIAMIVAALASWIFAINVGIEEGVTAFSVGSYALLVCWVGTMAFGADQHLRRVHFLAERGISPAKVWVSRLAVPFGVLTLLALTVLSIELFNDRGYELPPHSILISCAIAAVWSFVAISIAGWWGQLGFSRAVSLCGAPLAVVLLVSYFASIISMFVAPIWLVILMLPIPFLATRFSMRAWMDRRFTASYYVRHGLFLLMAVVVPLVPLGFQIATVARMSDANYRLYMNEYQQDVASNSDTGWAAAWRFEPTHLPFQIPTPLYEVLVEQNPPAGNGEGEINAEANLDQPADPNEVANLALLQVDQGAGLEGISGGMSGYVQEGIDMESKLREHRLKALKEMPPLTKVMDELIAQFDAALDNNPAPLRYSNSITLVATASLQATYAVSLNPDSEELQKRWESSVSLLGKIINRLRNSRTLVDQNYADDLEKTMLRILQSETTKQRLDKALYRSLANKLADSESRSRDRRRALLHSWQYDTFDRRISTDSAEFYQQLGGISLYGFRNDTIVKQTLLADSVRGYVVDLLIQLNSSRDPSSRQSLMTQLDNTLSPTIRKRLTGDWQGDLEKQAATLTQSN